MTHVIQFYRRVGAGYIRGADEMCFNIESTRPLKDDEVFQLRKVLADGFIMHTVQEKPFLQDERIIEVGPRLNFATPWSTNMVSICQAIGLGMITRLERSRRYIVTDDQDVEDFVDAHSDRMTECHYPVSLDTFNTGIVPEPVYEVTLIEDGPEVLDTIPGIAMDPWDQKLYYRYFAYEENRNPTIVEIMDLNNANSEHSRHGFFKSIQVIDGVEKDGTLFEMVASTLEAHPKGSVIAFKDNSSVIDGYDITTIVPVNPGEPSSFRVENAHYNPLLTAETHNFPTGVAPFPGAETGTGGRIRDVQGTGQGGYVIAGTAGYCVGNLNIPGYSLKWENQYPCPDNLASALDIEIQASNGASDYGNKFGEPLIQGFTRSFDLRLDSGERWGFLKPIMFTAGVGQMDARHTDKTDEEKGMIIVQVGGPAYRVGFGGGAASSMLQGENETQLDFNAVQRGDAEMEQKMNRVIRACNEMGDKTLIDVIHDQGAGGPANVLKELVEKSGGRIDIRLIKVGDPTMSVLEIYVAEFQERTGFLIRPENIEQFKAICEREKVNCEVLGEVTGDLRFVVYDSLDGSTPVDIHLPTLLGEIPQKTFTDDHVDSQNQPLRLREDLTVGDALYDVLRLVSVGSKRFLTNKVDRAVTGLIVQQQCCGPLQLTVSDVAVVAQSHFDGSGIATGIGEQAIKMLVNPSAGARMAVGESLTNIVWAGGIDPEQIKCSANWMWAPKLPGEGAAMRDAAQAMCDSMIAFGMAVDGGKDSLSMATIVEGETVKSPRELVISAYAAIPKIGKVITPDIKNPGGNILLFIDLAGGDTRLGGSALAQVHSQIGNESPDMNSPILLRKAFMAIQELIEKGLIRAGHDISDGGLVTAFLEMAFSGNCGLEMNIEKITESQTAISRMFAEELGFVVECDISRVDEINAVLCEHEVANFFVIGKTTEEKQIRVTYDGEVVLDKKMQELRSWWEETSYQIERLQAGPDCADEEKKNIHERKGPAYKFPFVVTAPDEELIALRDRPKVAILREEGSNSDREMTSAFWRAGFEPWDICMKDLLDGKVDLADFRGLAAVGGFSYADVPESAKGWASVILFNPKLKEMFDEFYNRPNTFTFGICNGCQLFALLGWVPFQGIDSENQPRFMRNVSGRFESRWSTVKVQKSKSIMLQGMEGLIFGIHTDHGEGQLVFPDESVHYDVQHNDLAPMVYVDDDGNATEKYPFNPNGSANGLAGLCSEDGRHLALMPHPERVFLPWQAHYLPEDMKDIPESPWMQMFKNAYDWCIETS